jgi:Fungal protein kinase
LLFDSHNISFQEFEDLYDDRFVMARVHTPFPVSSTKESVANIGAMGEFKYVANDDPFDDSSSCFERTATQARDTLGQICSYATAHAAAHFRIHLFSLLVFPQYARLLFWDRAGVIVTHQIDLKKHASVLAEFFWRYQHMSRTQRGYDDSIEEISDAECAEILRAVPNALTLLEVNE